MQQPGRAFLQPIMAVSRVRRETATALAPTATTAATATATATAIALAAVVARLLGVAKVTLAASRQLQAVAARVYDRLVWVSLAQHMLVGQMLAKELRLVALAVAEGAAVGEAWLQVQQQ